MRLQTRVLPLKENDFMRLILNEIHMLIVTENITLII